MPQAIPLAIMGLAGGISSVVAANKQNAALHQHDIGNVDLSKKAFGDAMANQNSQPNPNISLSPNGPNFSLPQFNQNQNMNSGIMPPRSNIRY